MKKDTLLFTNDIKAAIKEIQNIGGRISQEFTNHVFVANLPDSIDIKSLRFSSTKPKSKLDSKSELLSKSWNNLVDKSKNRSISRSISQTEGLKWDAEGYSTPNHPETLDDAELTDHHHKSAAPQRSTGTPSSLYMTGSIAVGIVIVSGNTDALRITEDEQTKLIQEIQMGLDFLANAEPRANITFKYDVNIIDIDAIPGSVSTFESAEAPWRNAALGQMSYDESRQGSIDYVNDLKDSKKTNWAYVAYFTKYPLHHFAYAEYEKTTMSFFNDGWGVDNIHKIFAHETCHVFGAADEYGDCSCNSRHGYLAIPNSNCTSCSGPQEVCLMSSNSLKLCEWTRGQLGWDESLFPQKEQKIGNGIFTIQQKSTQRYLDAFESKNKDFAVVTRRKQNNATQKWNLNLVGKVFTIQQKSSGRFLDAYSSANRDYSCVTRTAQNNDTQRWVILPSSNHLGTYTIQQLSNNRFLDAYETSSNSYSANTKINQQNDSQKWRLYPVGVNTYKLEHLVNGRFLSAYQNSLNDYSTITQISENDDAQHWILTPIGGVYNIQQMSSGRLLDAYETSDHDFSAVTRQSEFLDNQKFVILPSETGDYSIQQMSTSRFLDAYTTTARDHAVNTSTRQNDNTQRWILKRI